MRRALLFCLLACGQTVSSPPAGQDAAADVAIDAPDYGTCGAAAHACLCGCDGGATCDNGCYTTYPKCTDCLNSAATSCCPVEYPAYTKCTTDATTATDAGPAPCAPTDSACIDKQCQSQAAALQTCLATTGCKTAYALCNGTASCQ
jgi:hypothetical protein